MDIQLLEPRFALAVSPSAAAVDKTPPAAPTISAITDDVGALRGTIAINGVTDDAKPTLAGTAEAKSTVTILDGDTSLGTTTADSKGAWSFTPSASLADGSHVFKAKATDLAGNTGALSTGYAIKTDTQSPTAAVTVVPAAKTYKLGDTLSFTVTFDENAFVKLGSGTPAAAPSLAVTIGSAVRQANYVSGSGTKALVFSYKLSAGDNTGPATPIALGAAMTVPAGVTIHDAAGNNATPAFTSTASVAGVFVDTTAPTVSFESLPPARNSAVASIGLTFSEAVTGVKSGSFKLTRDNAVVAIGTATLTGSGAGYTIGNLAGFTATHGVYVLSLNPTGIADLAGNPAVGGHVTWTTDTTPPAAPVISTITDDLGAKQGDVASNGSTDDPTPTLKGTAEAGSTVAIFDGALKLGTTIAGPQGHWAFTPAALANGSHTFKAQATDAVGNTGVLSSGRTITIDAKPPTGAVTGVPAAMTYGLASYGAANRLAFTVTFDEPVYVMVGSGAAVPSIGVTVGSAVRQAFYASGSGTNKIVFEYVIEPGDITISTPIGLAESMTVPAGASIRNAGGADANPTFTSVASVAGIFVDAAGPVGTFSYLGARRTTAVSSVDITFNEPVVGVTLKHFKLTYNGKAVSLDAATLTGSGSKYTLGNLGGLTAGIGGYMISIDLQSSASQIPIVDQYGNPLGPTIVEWAMIPTRR